MPTLSFQDQDSKARPPVVAGWVLAPIIDRLHEADVPCEPTPVTPAEALAIAEAFDTAIARITGRPTTDFVGMVRAVNAQARDRAVSMVRTATIAAEYAAGQVALHQSALAEWNAAEGVAQSAVAS